MQVASLQMLKKLSATKVEDYFQGLKKTALELPDNIIAFCHLKISGSSRDASKHSRFVFLHNMGERGIIVLDEHMFEFDKGQSMLFFPFQSHYYLDVKDAGSWLFITFDMRNYDHLQTLQNRMILRPPRMDILLRDFLSGYFSDSNERVKGNHLSLLVAMMLEESLASFDPEKPEAPHEMICESRFEVLERLQRAVFQSIDKPVSITALANEVHISESHLRLLFRKEFGVSLGVYIRDAKMMRASRLLATTNLNVSEISGQCGYDTLFAFSRAFKTSRGVSPLQYRKSYLQR